MLLGLDAEKAFDRVDWLFQEHVLNKMGFDDVFSEWFRVLYRNSTSRLRVNGYISDSFPLKRGMCQGCCLSPILFGVISIEPIAELIN